MLYFIIFLVGLLVGASLVCGLVFLIVVAALSQPYRPPAPLCRTEDIPHDSGKKTIK